MATSTTTVDEPFISDRDDEISVPDDACPRSPCYSPEPEGLAFDVGVTNFNQLAYRASWVSKEPIKDQITYLFSACNYWESISKRKDDEIVSLKVKIAQIQAEKAFEGADSKELERLKRQTKSLFKGLNRIADKLEMFECFDEVTKARDYYDMFFDELIAELSYKLDEYGTIELERDLLKKRVAFVGAERDELEKRFEETANSIQQMELALKCAKLELSLIKSSNEELVAEVSEKTKAVESLISRNADLNVELRALARQVPEDDLVKSLEEAKKENDALMVQLEGFKSQVEYLCEEVKKAKESQPPQRLLRPLLDKELKMQYDQLQKSTSEFKERVFADQISQIGTNFTRLFELLNGEMKGDQSDQLKFLADKFGLDQRDINRLDIGLKGKKTTDPYIVVLNFFKLLNRNS